MSGRDKALLVGALLLLALTAGVIAAYWSFLGEAPPAGYIEREPPSW